MKTTLDEMQAFVQVIDSGSISAAAAQLEQTASGVSRALGRLEQKLGATLLRRTTRRLELTEEGEAYLLQARSILQAVEAAEEQMSVRRQRPAGRLRINAVVPFMLHVVVPLLDGFRQRYPQIELELQTDELFIDLLEQRTDLAIRIGNLTDSSLHARSLGSSRWRLMASPDYLQRAGTPATVEALVEHSLLGFSHPEHLNHWPLLHAQGDSWQIQPSVRASSGETLRELALAGQGITCLSDYMTHADQAAGRLVEVLPACNSGYRHPINAVYYRNSALALRIQCFLDYLSEWMANAELSPPPQQEKPNAS